MTDGRLKQNWLFTSANFRSPAVQHSCLSLRPEAEATHSSDEAQGPVTPLRACSPSDQHGPSKCRISWPQGLAPHKQNTDKSKRRSWWPNCPASVAPGATGGFLCHSQVNGPAGDKIEPSLDLQLSRPEPQDGSAGRHMCKARPLISRSTFYYLLKKTGTLGDKKKTKLK